MPSLPALHAKIAVGQCPLIFFFGDLLHALVSDSYDIRYVSTLTLSLSMLSQAECSLIEKKVASEKNYGIITKLCSVSDIRDTVSWMVLHPAA